MRPFPQVPRLCVVPSCRQSIILARSYLVFPRLPLLRCRASTPSRPFLPLHTPFSSSRPLDPVIKHRPMPLVRATSKSPLFKVALTVRALASQALGLDSCLLLECFLLYLDITTPLLASFPLPFCLNLLSSFRLHFPPYSSPLLCLIALPRPISATRPLLRSPGHFFSKIFIFITVHFAALIAWVCRRRDRVCFCPFPPHSPSSASS